MVVGIRQTSSETSTATVGTVPDPAAVTLYCAKGCSVTTASRKISVRPAIRMLSAISLGVFWRSAPSTSAIMRSRNVSPGLDVMRIWIWSESTLVPPVTALRSPPDSRITGALSPVMTDSSTVAMPSITSPSPGMMSPGFAHHDVAGAQLRGRHLFGAICPTTRRRHRVGLGLAQRVGLRLAARFRHRFGEVGEQHREPQPQRDLKRETDARRADGDIADQEDRGDAPRRLPPRTSPDS